MAFPIAAIIQQAAGTTASVVSQYLAGKQQQAYYKALKENYNTNAEINDIQTARQAAYINESAASQTHQLRAQGEGTAASAKAAMVASGMDLSSGSAQAVLSSSERALKEDEDLLRYQAEVQAFENNKQGAISQFKKPGKNGANYGSRRRQTGPFGGVGVPFNGGRANWRNIF